MLAVGRNDRAEAMLNTSLSRFTVPLSMTTCVDKNKELRVEGCLDIVVSNRICCLACVYVLGAFPGIRGDPKQLTATVVDQASKHWHCLYTHYQGTIMYCL